MTDGHIESTCCEKEFSAVYRCSNRAERECRGIVEDLIASFERARDGWPPPGMSATDLGVLTQLREAFIAAGVERVRGLLRPHAWIQLDLSFTGPDQGRRFSASPRLRAAVERWRASGLVSQFWFMHKPPGMRLRFLIPDADPRAEAEILAFMQEAEHDDLIDNHAFGMYDEELHQFGGETGLDLFHRFSTYDSLCVLRFREHEASGAATIDPTVLSLLALCDLFGRVTGDPWEQWDLWCELRITGRLFDADTPIPPELRAGLDDNRELLEAIVFEREAIIAGLEPVEAAIVAAYSRGNQELADGLAKAVGARALSFAPRKLLPFYVVFHWNRMGLSIDDQISLATFMFELLNPKYLRRLP